MHDILYFVICFSDYASVLVVLL